MKCPICGKSFAGSGEICQSCKDGMKPNKDGLKGVISRHKRWAINNLLNIDDRLDFLKDHILKFEKEIIGLEKRKLKLVEEIKCSNGTFGG